MIYKSVRPTRWHAVTPYYYLTPYYLETLRYIKTSCRHGGHFHPVYVETDTFMYSPPISVDTHICIRMLAIYKYTYINIHIYTDISVSIYILIDISGSIYMSAYLYSCLYLCIYSCLYLYIYSCNLGNLNI